MKRFIMFRLAPVIFLAALFGYLIINKSSYVLLRYENFAFETSLWFFGILLVFTYYLSHFIFSLLSKLYRPGRKWNDWKYQRRLKAAQKDFYQGIFDFEQGAWNKALKRFKIAANYIDRPLVAFIFAARSANKMGLEEEEKDMLHRAIQSEPNESLTVGIVRAELLIDSNNKSEAEFVLNELKASAGSHPRIKELLSSLN